VRVPDIFRPFFSQLVLFFDCRVGLNLRLPALQFFFHNINLASPEKYRNDVKKSNPIKAGKLLGSERLGAVVLYDASRSQERCG
jgi:hypothetical protein